MPTLQSFPQLPVPPPPRASRLLDETGVVGGIDSDRLRFTGFSTLEEAAAAAWVAHVALERRAAKSRREPAPYLEPNALQLVRSEDGEWIQSGATRLARLVRPAGPSAWFGIEVVLPPNASELMIGSSAQVVYRGLRRSNVRWPIRDETRRVTMPEQPDRAIRIRR